MDIFVLFCLIYITNGTPTLSQWVSPNPQYSLEQLDRARSAWNFGGHNPRVVQQWATRAKTLPPSATVADRRLGWSPYPVLPQTPQAHPFQYLKKSHNPAKYNPFLTPKSRNPPVKRKSPLSKKKHNENKPKPQRKIPAKVPKVFTTYQPKPKRSHKKAPMSYSEWKRGPPRISSRSDSPMDRFKKEDLWHLDKGESFELETNDIEYDKYLRAFENEEDEHDEEDKYEHSDDHDSEHHASLEHHHEHQEEHEEKEEHVKSGEPCKIHKDEPKKKAKKPKHRPHPQVTPAILPRIHNPIPLGCLLAVPSFHPIRPRHHLTCLLSIPGTPNMMKRRRRRSAETMEQPPNEPAVTSNNRRMGLAATRKRYENHLGGGKGLLPPPQPFGHSNYKIPATIIAPPKFEKSDVLKMLVGSSGVNPTDMGSVVLTNNRYVRIGRGLPNSARTGRTLWTSPFVADNQQSASAVSSYTNIQQRSPVYRAPSSYSDQSQSASAPKPFVVNVQLPAASPALTLTLNPSPPLKTRTVPAASTFVKSNSVQDSGEYSDWKPIVKSNKGLPKTIEVGEQLRTTVNDVAEHVPKTTATTSKLVHGKEEKETLPHGSHRPPIDISDLMEALGYYDDSFTQVEADNVVDEIEDDDLVALSSDVKPTLEEDDTLVSSSDSISYAVKNDVNTGPTDSMDESASASQAYVHIYKKPRNSRRKLAKRKRIPKPILIRVPKDGGYY